MKNQKQALQFLLFLGWILLISCKKNQNKDSDNFVIETPGKENGIYIPAKISTGKSNMIFSYTADLALSKINYENGDSTTLKYTASGHPYRLYRYNAGIIISKSFYTLDKNGLIISAELFKGPTKIGWYRITYTPTDQIATVTYSDSSGNLSDEQKYTYNKTGDLSNIKSAGSSLSDYQYDTKNALFKQVKYSWLFAIEKEDHLFLSSISNIQNCNYPNTSKQNETFSYLYNEGGYPKKITTKFGGQTSVATVTYQ